MISSPSLKPALFVFFLLGTLAFAQSAPQPSPNAAGQPGCEQLTHLAIPGAKILRAQLVPAGTFSGPPSPFANADLSGFYKTLPAFCRVSAQSTPTPDSDIKIEVWLPASNWNGKLQGLGNGGFAGLIDYLHLGASVRQGYAATGTDAGHVGTPVDAAWAIGHPEKVTDFGHRGIHEMTRVAKAVMQAFYLKAPQHSYFAGCSDGGREALTEAQRYPADYDGILAGAPANYWTALLSTAIVDTQALTVNPASFIPPAKIPVISAAVLAACDRLDGVEDGILNDPRQCHFDPATLVCKSGEESEKCLTAPQAAALKTIYAGPRDAQGHTIFPGYLPGAEDGPGGWALWITGPAPLKSLMAFFGLGYFANMVYEKPDWDYTTFTLEAGMKAAEEKSAQSLNAIDANLQPFQARGGKLILYHGWEDPAIPALNTIDYYNSVTNQMGQTAADGFMRLYMIPGLQHCGDGPGAAMYAATLNDVEGAESAFRMALEQWVEKKTAPAILNTAAPTASGKVTRPLCAYPQTGQYKGAGDTSDGATFACKAAK